VMKGHGIQIVRIAHSGSPVTAKIMDLFVQTTTFSGKS